MQRAKTRETHGSSLAPEIGRYLLPCLRTMVWVWAYQRMVPWFHSGQRRHLVRATRQPPTLLLVQPPPSNKKNRTTRGAQAQLPRHRHAAPSVSLHPSGSGWIPRRRDVSDCTGWMSGSRLKTLLPVCVSVNTTLLDYTRRDSRRPADPTAGIQK